MLKETQWKLIAQCLTGMLSGMAGGILGFAVGIGIGINIFDNYEIGGQYGILIGILIGSILGIIIFNKIKIKSYKNISTTELFMVMMIVITAITSGFLARTSMLFVTTGIMTLFMIFSLVPSLLMTLCIYFYKKNISKS